MVNEVLGLLSLMIIKWKPCRRILRHIKLLLMLHLSEIIRWNVIRKRLLLVLRTHHALVIFLKLLSIVRHASGLSMPLEWLLRLHQVLILHHHGSTTASIRKHRRFLCCLQSRNLHLSLLQLFPKRNNL